jgi:voltage-dependent potassium channel beta subunit
MEYRKLGKSGLKVSALSFGSWVTFSNQVSLKPAMDMMAYAYENGINFFDNAEVYAEGESEKIMGEVIKKLNWSRDTFIVSSKVFWGGQKPTQLGLSRKHTFDACHAALKRLQVDYLDLYFCHRPDIETPIEETVWAMNDLIRQGKIMYWGTSEWEARQLNEAYEIAEKLNLIGPTMEQPEYNMFNRYKVEEEFGGLYSEYGLGTTIWSPLASGLLTGKYSEGIPKDSRANIKGYGWLKEKFESTEGQTKIKKVNQLKKIADDLNITLPQMSIAWCMKNPNVSTVILGASKIEQLKENMKAFDAYPKLAESVMKEIDKVLK